MLHSCSSWVVRKWLNAKETCCSYYEPILFKSMRSPWNVHVLFGRHLLDCGIQEEGRWCSVLALNVLSVSCTGLLPGTLEEGQGEGSLDLDCVGYSFHLQQVWKYPRRAALCSLVVWKFQSPDLSANIRPAKGHASCTVNTSWSPYTFLGRCITCMLEPLFDPFSSVILVLVSAF